MDLSRCLGRGAPLIAGLLIVVGCSGSSGGTSAASPTPSPTPTPTPTPTVAWTPAALPAGWKSVTVAQYKATFGLPSNWTASETGDVFVDPDASAIVVLGSSTPLMTLTLEDYKAVDIESFEGPLDDQGPATLGGVQAWTLQLHSETEGKTYYVVDHLTVRKNKTYDLICMSEPGNETADFAFCEQVRSTFTFTD